MLLLEQLRTVIKAFSETARAAALESRRAKARAKQERGESTPSLSVVDDVDQGTEGPSFVEGEGIHDYADRITSFSRNVRGSKKINASEKLIGNLKASDLGVAREIKAATETSPGDYLMREGFVIRIDRAAGSINGVSRNGKEVSVFPKISESELQDINEQKLLTALQSKRTELFN